MESCRTTQGKGTVLPTCSVCSRGPEDSEDFAVRLLLDGIVSESKYDYWPRDSRVLALHSLLSLHGPKACLDAMLSCKEFARAEEGTLCHFVGQALQPHMPPRRELMLAANVNSRHGEFLNTCLHMALLKGWYDSACAIMDHPETDLRAANIFGWSLADAVCFGTDSFQKPILLSTLLRTAKKRGGDELVRHLVTRRSNCCHAEAESGLTTLEALMNEKGRELHTPQCERELVGILVRNGSNLADRTEVKCRTCQSTRSDGVIKVAIDTGAVWLLDAARERQLISVACGEEPALVYAVRTQASASVVQTLCLCAITDVAAAYSAYNETAKIFSASTLPDEWRTKVYAALTTCHDNIEAARATESPRARPFAPKCESEVDVVRIPTNNRPIVGEAEKWVGEYERREACLVEAEKAIKGYSILAETRISESQRTIREQLNTIDALEKELNACRLATTFRVSLHKHELERLADKLAYKDASIAKLKKELYALRAGVTKTVADELQARVDPPLPHALRCVTEEPPLMTVMAICRAMAENGRNDVPVDSHSPLGRKILDPSPAVKLTLSKFPEVLIAGRYLIVDATLAQALEHPHLNLFSL